MSTPAGAAGPAGTPAGGAAAPPAGTPPAGQGNGTPTPDPAGTTPQGGGDNGMIPRHRFNEVEAERRRLAQELETRQRTEEEARRREESAVQRAERERDEARAAQQALQAQVERSAREGRIRVAAGTTVEVNGQQVPLVRGDAVEALVRLANVDTATSEQAAVDAVRAAVAAYPFLAYDAATAGPAPPARQVGQPVQQQGGQPVTPDASTPQGQAEARRGLASWLQGTVLQRPPGAPGG